MGRLEGKVALIVGAGSGIGRASALLFAKEGAHVAAADITGMQDKAVDEIRSAGGDAFPVQADVSKSADVQAMYEVVRKQYGRLDVLFNCAAFPIQRMTLVECPEEYFDNVIATNLRGTFLTIKYGIPFMVETGGGTIVNMSSIAGLNASPHAGAYGASKGGVVQLTKTAAIEFASQGIRANAICPSAIDTPRLSVIPDYNEKRVEWAAGNPLGRMGRPEEIAQTALFLASDESSFVTGVAMPVDGGSYAK
jgi:NAD(P)-dependent dehydrogenase (short-subunit alcohol dehydrogenase family)